MAENQQLVAKHVPEDLYAFLDASISSATSPEEAYGKFDRLARGHAEELRRLTKKIQDARMKKDAEATKTCLARYDDALERYVPALMAQAKIYWDLGQYAQVEKILRASSETCGEHECFRLNLAHVVFMQSLADDDKYGDAVELYEPIVRRSLEDGDLLGTTAIVLANLCVAYIMTSQNEEAEELMRRIEKEEEAAPRRTRGSRASTCAS